jgi:hypothetical protein
MNDHQERTIVEGLRALSATTKNAAASRQVERALLAAFEGRRQGQPRGLPMGWFVYAAAAALFLVSISGAWLARESTRTGPGPIHPAGFVEIPGTSALPPMESGSIVRVALPVTVLPQYGLAILPDVANDMVEAELLIAQDGLPRMIRLAQDDSTRSTP